MIVEYNQQLQRKNRVNSVNALTDTDEGNTEPSRRMKYACGRCDGQSVPRIGMRLASALPEREEMTWATRKLVEVETRKSTVTEPIISPTDTPLFTMFRKTKVNNVQTEWLTDKLDQAASNAKAEGSSATFQTVQGRDRLLNYTQISREDYDISDTQRAVRIGRTETQLYARNSLYPKVRIAA